MAEEMCVILVKLQSLPSVSVLNHFYESYSGNWSSDFSEEKGGVALLPFLFLQVKEIHEICR